MATFGTLHFLPWLRRGFARSITNEAVDGLPPAVSGTLTVSLAVGGDSGLDSDPIEQTVALRGPESVVGLSPGQIVRTDPVDGTIDFEQNYFPCVEFAEADLPWMFTPASPGSDGKLVPWLALVVVRETAGISISSGATAPLPVLRIANPADATVELPNLDEAWAWGHVQTTADLDKSSVEDAYAAAPHHFLSRLVCPRRLDPRTSYIAAVVPTFEDGRRAGLGMSARESVDTSEPGWWKAWSAAAEVELPVYHSWRFQTGPEGDFEELVRRLTPRELDAGTRDFDIGHAGSSRLPPRPAKDKIVSWKGALLSPAATVVDPDVEHWNKFQVEMHALIGDATESKEPDKEPDKEPGKEPKEEKAQPAYQPLLHDPVIGPPGYGLLASGEDDVPEPMLGGKRSGKDQQPRWLAQANLEPTHRSAAGLGSEVVRRNQESLMASAWNQATSLQEINQVLNWTRTAAEVATLQKTTKLGALSDAALLHVTASAHSRLRVKKSQTAAGLVASTSLPAGMTSAAFRRVARPNGPIGRATRAVRSVASNPATSVTSACIKDLDRTLAYTKYLRPVGLQVGDELVTMSVPEVAEGGPGLARGSTGRAAASRQTTRRRNQSVGRRPLRGSPESGPRSKEPARLTAQSLSAGWTRDEPIDGATIAEMPSAYTAGAPYIAATESLVSHTPETRGQEALSDAAAAVRDALDPMVALSAKLAARISAPGEPFASDAIPLALEADPVFPQPLYELLRKLDPEFLLPGVGEIPKNTVGLTEVNAAFVEAFLIGANDELASEFLWREYPADLRDTWLRTFWDAIPGPDQEPDAAIEDIGRIRNWKTGVFGKGATLGAHQVGPGADGTLVLVIRAELLRKYPDTVIYATRGRWNPKRVDADGDTIEASTYREEELDVDGSSLERRDPVFAGSLNRDTIFLGFELTTVAALGDVDSDGAPVPGGDAGWFFVFEETPTGPRFGLDVGEPKHARANPNVEPRFWRDVSWYHQVDDADALAALPYALASGRLHGAGARWYDDPSTSDGKFSAAWGTGAAEMARVTLQRPARMLVHASAMLPEKS